MKRIFPLVLLMAILGAGGCATKEAGAPSEPQAGGWPGPDRTKWEYRTVMLEGVSTGDLNAQLLRWNSQGWEMVNTFVDVRRGGLGYIAYVPMRRRK
jgi:hypothetical protein